MARLLLLEDNADRRAGLVSGGRGLGLGDPVCWSSAVRMIEEMEGYLADAELISLDHDLYPMDSEQGDPGDGLMVARYLATKSPACPVIVHSSNGDEARRMAGELDLAGWKVRRVLPFGTGWVENDWACVARELLGMD
ncbi:MAG: cyclic-phosphate processing receiver domain-containing protein [Planctomycetota bacterium]